MRRTQLYLDEDLWQTLHANAKSQRTTISDLVRQAVREKYSIDFAARRKAMQGLVGLWKDRDDIPDATEYIRSLRKGTRLAALERQ